MPPAAEPAGKKRMTPQRIIILSIIGVLVVGVGIWAFISSKKATVNAKAGDCIKVEGSTTVGIRTPARSTATMPPRCSW